MSIKVEEIDNEIQILERLIRKSNIDTTKGLPESVFLFGSSIMPIVNVDLLITDDKRRVLLSWRDDVYHGKGWHIPGGCVRLKEHLVDRVKKTAIEELGCEVKFDPKPIQVEEGIIDFPRPWLDNELVRSHNVSLLYHASVPEEYKICNGNKSERDAGFLKWFDYIHVQHN